MRTRAFHRRLVLAARSLAVLYLLVATGPATALVYCVGEDHEAIESLLAERCCDPSPALRAEIAPDEDHCACIDTPLVLQAALQSRPDELAAPLVSQSVALRVAPACSRTGNERTAASVARLRHSPHPLALRSVILLL